MKLYSLQTNVYLDPNTDQYKNIISINKKPDGPLSNYVREIKNNKLSIFDSINNNNKCFYGILNMENNYELIELCDIDILFNFLFTNNYIIQKDFNKLNFKSNLSNNLISYIYYNN